MTPPAVTPRQREIWRRIADGQPNKQIAHELGVSPFTVGNQREELYARLGCNSAVQCTRLAVRYGVVSEPVLVEQVTTPADRLDAATCAP